MNTKTVIHSLPATSGDFSSEPVIELVKGGAIIRFGYFDQARMQRVHQIVFHRVRAVDLLKESHCASWHIEGAFELLVQVDESDWLERLIAQTSDTWAKNLPLNHYMIYFEGLGCFQCIATGWDVQDNVSE